MLFDGLLMGTPVFQVIIQPLFLDDIGSTFANKFTFCISGNFIDPVAEVYKFNTRLTAWEKFVLEAR